MAVDAKENCFELWDLKFLWRLKKKMEKFGENWLILQRERIVVSLIHTIQEEGEKIGNYF